MPLLGLVPDLLLSLTSIVSYVQTGFRCIQSPHLSPFGPAAISSVRLGGYTQHARGGERLGPSATACRCERLDLPPQPAGVLLPRVLIYLFSVT